MTGTLPDLRAEILAQVGRLAPGRTLCPSQVARAVSEDWRGLMAPVRAAAMRLAREGRVRITQGGRTCPPDAPMRGPIRLGPPD